MKSNTPPKQGMKNPMPAKPQTPGKPVSSSQQRPDSKNPKR